MITANSSKEERVAWLEIEIAREEVRTAELRSVLKTERVQALLPSEFLQPLNEAIDVQGDALAAERRVLQLELKRHIPAHAGAIDTVFAVDSKEDYDALPVPAPDSTSDIDVEHDKADIIRDLAEYPLPLLQWFVDTIDAWWASERTRGEEFADVLNLLHTMARPDVVPALWELHGRYWGPDGASRRAGRGPVAAVHQPGADGVGPLHGGTDMTNATISMAAFKAAAEQYREQRDMLLGVTGDDEAISELDHRRDVLMDAQFKMIFAYLRERLPAFTDSLDAVELRRMGQV